MTGFDLLDDVTIIHGAGKGLRGFVHTIKREIDKETTYFIRVDNKDPLWRVPESNLKKTEDTSPEKVTFT